MCDDQPPGAGLSRLVSGLPSAHVMRSPFVVAGIRRFRQHKIETGAELGQRPLRAGVGRVAQGPSPTVDSHRQCLHRMIGAMERAGQRSDAHRVTVRHLVEGNDRGHLEVGALGHAGRGIDRN